jgi:hypothetical protein
VWFRSSDVGVGTELVNARVRVALPNDRWLWFTTGPSWGPRVLLWAYVLLLLAAAAVLTRLPRNPLRRGEWWLLGLGLTQAPVGVAVFIAAWFFAIALRGTWQPTSEWYKRLVQFSLAVFTLVFLGCLAGTVYAGLVENPDMLVSGTASAESLGLAWYVDRAAETFPVAHVLSMPLWVWRLLNLVWALWLAMSLVRWLRWAWGESSRGGLWALALASPRPRPEPAAPPTTAAEERPTDAGADLPPEEAPTGGDEPSSD